MIRSSLKRMEAQVQVPHIKRCHRAFMVNLSKVTKVEGNAAGYSLSFSESDTQVPVSRNYGPEVMAYFKAGV
jgi:DNA-binding LytR/AlgR family response regulator